MYRLLRTIHLTLGTFGFSFLLMYGVSAVQMGHFNIKADITETRAAVAAELSSYARAIARDLMEQAREHSSPRSRPRTRGFSSGWAVRIGR
jgi:hypothetical protein